MPHEVLQPGFERRDERGVLFEVLNGFSAQTLLCGRMNAGAVMGNHYHKKTRVFFYLLRGEAKVETVNIETLARDAFGLSENQGVFLEPGESHAIRYVTDSEFLMLKSPAYDPADPDTYTYPVSPSPSGSGGARGVSPR